MDLRFEDLVFEYASAYAAELVEVNSHEYRKLVEELTEDENFREEVFRFAPYQISEL